MKNLIIFAIAAVAGYFAYQHFLGSSPQDSLEASGDSGPVSYTYLPSVPTECEAKGKTMGDAIYGRDIGRVSVSQLNYATRTFQSCLRDAGFSDSEINGTYDKIKQDVLSLNPGSAQGY
jgi:hypothetical protein